MRAPHDNAEPVLFAIGLVLLFAMCSGCDLFDPAPIAPPYVLRAPDGLDLVVVYEAALAIDNAAGVEGCATVSAPSEPEPSTNVARIEIGDCPTAQEAACTWGAARSARPRVILDRDFVDHPKLALILAHEVIHWAMRAGNEEHDEWGLFSRTVGGLSDEIPRVNRERLRRACGR